MKKRNIFPISSMTDWHVNDTLIETDRELVSILNQSLQINGYTKKITRVNLVFMVMNPSTHSFRPDKKFWRWKAGHFDMYMNVPDYDKFRTATKPEARKIIAELYLTGIKKYLSKQKDFNHELFYKDVKELFQKEGIL